jgi:hypothetical protein
MSDVFDEAISRPSPPHDPARIAAVIASDQRFAYFGTAAFTVRLLRLDQKIVGGVPMSLKRVTNVLGTDAMLFQAFCDRLSRYGDKTLVLFADGQAVRCRCFPEVNGCYRLGATTVACGLRTITTGCCGIALLVIGCG